jgi:hypothetical protein
MQKENGVGIVKGDGVICADRQVLLQRLLISCLKAHRFLFLAVLAVGTKFLKVD